MVWVVRQRLSQLIQCVEGFGALAIKLDILRSTSPFVHKLVLSELPSRAVWVAVDIGLSKSATLSTLPSPIIAFVVPVVVPVNIGLADGAFMSRALCNPATSLVSIPVILLPSATGPFQKASPFMVAVPIKTALKESTLILELVYAKLY